MGNNLITGVNLWKQKGKVAPSSPLVEADEEEELALDFGRPIRFDLFIPSGNSLGFVTLLFGEIIDGVCGGGGGGGGVMTVVVGQSGFG